MRFTPGQALAFGDWFELDQIGRALIAVHPELAGTLQFDPLRPLLQIPRQRGGTAVVARMIAAEPTPWLVGIPGTPEPVTRELDSAAAVVALMLEMLLPPDPALGVMGPAPQG